jgi:adenylate kinase
VSNLILVGGIHGAGKTTVSRRVATLLSATHASAGSLIAEAAGRHVITVNAGSKAVRDVDGNQALLLQGLASLRERIAGPLVLDGHLCLMNGKGEIAEISVEVFKAIEPAAVLLVMSDPVIVHARLLERGGEVLSLDVVRTLSAREAAHAAAVAEALGTPLVQARGDGDPDDAAMAAAARLRAFVEGP